MPRGGIHKGTLKPDWNAGKTCTIRVPEARKKEILAIAKAMDQIDYNAEVVDKSAYNEAKTILLESLTLPKNNGSAYRKQIIRALQLMGEEIDFPRKGTKTLHIDD